MPKKIAPWQTWKLFFSPGNLNNKTIHIRALIDEEWIVYRKWSKRKQRWLYFIEHIYLLEMYIENGYMKLMKEGVCQAY